MEVWKYVSSLTTVNLPNLLPSCQLKGSRASLGLPLQQSQPFSSNFSMDSVTYTKLIQSASKSGSLNHGKLVHGHMIKTFCKPCLFLLNNLLHVYGKFGDMFSAHNLFDKMPSYDIITYNSLISGYSQLGRFYKGIVLFNEARMMGLKLDKFTYAGALTICCQLGDLSLGKKIHGMISINGSHNEVVLTNSLINMYSKCENVDLARVLFESSNNLDNISWNSLIAGYVRNGDYEESLRILVKMHQYGLSLNSYTLGSVLKACSISYNDIKKPGEILHCYTIRVGLDMDMVVSTALINMYANTGNLKDAIQIFEKVSNHNVIMYNTMIDVMLLEDCTTDEYAYEALNLFLKMQNRGIKPSKFTYSIVLKACKVAKAFGVGKQIHAQICKDNLQSDEYIGSALIDTYSLSESMEEALTCFNSILHVDNVSMTAIIVGYLQNGQFENALDWFYKFLPCGIKPDEYILSSVLGACAELATVRSGEQLHGYATKTGIGKFIVVQNSQVCMYSKSGDIRSANLMFEEIDNPDVVSWSAMICGNAHHGLAWEALRLFDTMKGCGIEPNHISFLGVLTACSHGGLVEEGLRHFESMKHNYGIMTHVKHCACVVDLLGRAGRLADAENLILKSGFELEPVMWRVLLSACRIHKDTTNGKRIAEKVIELEPQASAPYVLLYNLYAEAGIKSSAFGIRGLIEDRKIKKEPGLSWTEVGNKVHSFVVGDSSHPNSELIYEKLREMIEKSRKLNLTDNMLVFDGAISLKNFHSEKLAVAFGVLSLPRSAPVRVMKNLRVCVECHTTMKLFSLVEQREIVLRDPTRFHHFKEGSCSCCDYW